MDEVRSYCAERGNGVDPERFVDHYTANGWVQGRQGKPVRDWKACVRTWEKNDFGGGKASAAVDPEVAARYAAGRHAEDD